MPQLERGFSNAGHEAEAVELAARKFFTLVANLGAGCGLGLVGSVAGVGCGSLRGCDCGRRVLVTCGLDRRLIRAWVRTLV